GGPKPAWYGPPHRSSPIRLDGQAIVSNRGLRNFAQLYPFLVTKFKAPVERVQVGGTQGQAGYCQVALRRRGTNPVRIGAGGDFIAFRGQALAPFLVRFGAKRILCAVVRRPE